MKLLVIFYVLFQTIRAEPKVCLSNSGTCYLGSWLQTSSGQEYQSYQGIRYAEPPIGNLRFKPTDLHIDSPGLYDVSNEAKSICPQENYDFTKKYDLSEDCLFLNIYVPETNTSLLPVMFFIHGGAFTLGSGTFQDYNPSFFMENEVILVTINYRLGPFGYLYLDPDIINGNAGFMDQMQALKWVQRNIESFGGDPGSVTIFGESAGSNSVTYMILSPLAQGLFKRAIMQSGTAIDPAWPVLSLEQGKNQGEYVMNELKCSDLKCLQSKSTDDILAILKDMDYWNAVYETPFLPKSPKNLLESGEFDKDIEVLMGTNKDEGILALIDYIIDPNKWSEWRNNYSMVGPFQYLGKFNQSEITPIDIEKAYKVIENYVGSIENINENNLQDLINSKTDAEYFYGTYKTLDYFLKHDMKVYQYILTFVGSHSFSEIFGVEPMGVCHADDIRYLFPAQDDTLETTEEINVKDFMVSSWVNFATFGDPTPPGSKFSWLPSKSANMFMNISGSNPQMTAFNDNIQHRVDFWQSLE